MNNKQYKEIENMKNKRWPRFSWILINFGWEAVTRMYIVRSDRERENEYNNFKSAPRVI